MSVGPDSVERGPSRRRDHRDHRERGPRCSSGRGAGRRGRPPWRRGRPPWHRRRPPWHRSPLRRYVHARLHRRLFVWFGLSIALTATVVGGVLWLSSRGHPPWQQHLDGVDSFIGARFAAVVDDPAARVALTEELARDLGGATLMAADGQVLHRAGDRCTHTARTIELPGGVGVLTICSQLHHRGGPGFALLLLVAAGATLWLASGLIARRLARPLGTMARVARDIGDGRLDSRVPTHCHSTGEFSTLGDAINDMAERIAGQLREQRELLAAVSHELRTPLGHMRVIVEMLEPLAAGDSADVVADTEAETKSGARPTMARELERELVEMDALVGQLLASSRVDFDAVDIRPLDATDLAVRALERAALDPALLVVDADDTAIEGDVNLLSRALANLLDNARRHGDGAVALRVSRAEGDEGQVRFEVEDDGPGLAEDERAQIFERFYRGQRRAGASSLGLGLSLVRRIAEAHGGRAWAENRAERGARVGFSVAVPPS